MNRMGLWKRWGGWSWCPVGCFPGENRFRTCKFSVGWGRTMALDIGWRFIVQQTAHLITGVVIHIQGRMVILGMLHSREELGSWLQHRPRRSDTHPEYLKPWGIV